MNSTHSSIGMMRRITSDAEHNEAAGFVLDCILSNGMIDDPLGDSAALRPTDVVRDSEGKLLFVLCAVRPCEANQLSGLLAEDDNARVLIGAA
jgi:hypothetical protein